MRAVRQRRPDLELLVNDVSPDACGAAAAAGFATHCGDATTIDGRHETVVVSDALYYVPELAACWAALQRLVKPGGWLVLRIPNRSLAIQATLRLRPNEPLRVDLPAYNPEHLYLFTRPYLRRRLSAAGFTRVQVLGSPFVGTSRANALAFRLLGPLALTSSVLVLAQASPVRGHRHHA